MENFKSSFRWGLQPQGGCSRTCGGGSQVVHDDGDGEGDGDGGGGGGDDDDDYDDWW